MFGLNVVWHIKLISKCIYCSGTLEINCSKDIKIQGIIGPCTSLEKVSYFFSCLMRLPSQPEKDLVVIDRIRGWFYFFGIDI